MSETPSTLPVVRIYTTPLCAYCARAKALLAEKGVSFDEIPVADDAEKQAWLLETTGLRTVPQIFIADRPIGGYAELVALDRSGDLDRLLR
jgi:glutaredoxin 3